MPKDAMKGESWWLWRGAAECGDSDGEYEAYIDGLEAESFGPDEWPCFVCGAMKPGCECDVDESMRALDDSASTPVAPPPETQSEGKS